MVLRRGWAAAVMAGYALVAPAQAATGLGLNLVSLDTFSPTLPTIDLMKRAGPWLTQCHEHLPSGSCRNFPAGQSGWDTREQDKLDLDADGWLRRLPDADDPAVRYRFVSTIVATGDYAPSGRYVVLYDGVGQLSYGIGARKVEAGSARGRDLVDFNAARSALWLLSITRTDPGNPIRNIRVIPPGGVCRQAAGVLVSGPADCRSPKSGFVSLEELSLTQVWHPRFIQDLQGWRHLRYMDWLRTNTSALARWDQRPLLGQRTWGGPFGAPLETVAALSKATQTDAWINVPTQASDDYVLRLGQLFRQQMPPGQRLIVEYGNEAWNQSFQNSAWILNQAKQAWPDRAAVAANAGLLQSNWYARRSVQVCQLVRAAFRDHADQVKCVIGSQAASAGRTDQTLSCELARAELGGPCSKFVDAVAIAPYFGNYIGEARFRSITDAWGRDRDAGLSMLFAEILGVQSGTTPLSKAGAPHPDGALASTREWMRETAKVASRHGLPMWGYEAGQHLLVRPPDSNPTLLSLMIAANRDPRMGQAYTRMLNDWIDAGGQDLSLFNHSFTPSKWGMWGLKESPWDEQGVKWHAVEALRREKGCWWTQCGK